jgi:hypothetical protein
MKTHESGITTDFDMAEQLRDTTLSLESTHKIPDRYFTYPYRVRNCDAGSRPSHYKTYGRSPKRTTRSGRQERRLSRFMGCLLRFLQCMRAEEARARPYSGQALDTPSPRALSTGLPLRATPVLAFSENQNPQGKIRFQGKETVGFVALGYRLKCPHKPQAL